MPRVLFYVQHLVGLGHDARAAITRKLVQLGAEVTCVTGCFEDVELDLSGARYLTLQILKASNPLIKHLSEIGANRLTRHTGHVGLNHYATRLRMRNRTF